MEDGRFHSFYRPQGRKVMFSEVCVSYFVHGRGSSSGQRPPWIETILDRDTPGHRSPEQRYPPPPVASTAVGTILIECILVSDFFSQSRVGSSLGDRHLLLPPACISGYTPEVPASLLSHLRQWRIKGGTKIFLISCSFWENPANLYVGAPPPPGVGAPSYGESCIRPCITH